MRVVLVSPNFYPKVGGIESHLFEVLQHLRDIEFSVVTNWRPDWETQASTFPGVEFAYVWPSDRPPRKLARSRTIMRAGRAFTSGMELLRTINRKGQIDGIDGDVIHVHYLNMDQLDRAARRLGLESLIPWWYTWFASTVRLRAPTVFTDHTVFTAPDDMVPRATKQALLGAFQNIISVDQASHDVVRVFQKVKGGRSWFVPNSVDTERFTPRVRPPDRKFTVGYAARVGKLGQGLLHDAFRDLKDDVNWHFALGGHQVHLVSTELRGLCPQAKVFENLDYVSMPDFYASLDVLVNPFPAEGVGRTTLEAMACGVPVVGVGTGDKYPIRHRETGFLLPPDSHAISNLIRELANTPDLARSVGARAREVIVNEYSNQKILPRLREVYREVREKAEASRVH